LPELVACFEDVLRDALPVYEPAATSDSPPPALPDLNAWCELMNEAEQALAPNVVAPSLPLEVRTSEAHPIATVPTARAMWTAITAGLFPGASAVVVDTSGLVSAGEIGGVRQDERGFVRTIRRSQGSSMPATGFDRAVLRAIAQRSRMQAQRLSVPHSADDSAPGALIGNSTRGFYALRATCGGRLFWLLRTVPAFCVQDRSGRVFAFSSAMIGIVFDPKMPAYPGDPVCLTRGWRHPFVHAIPGPYGARQVCVEGLADLIRREAELVLPRRLIMMIDVAATALLGAAHDGHGYSRLDELVPLPSKDARDPRAVFVPWTQGEEDLDDFELSNDPW
jgi:hypothetical protein